MSWPTFVVADILSGGKAKTRGMDLYDRAMCAKSGGSTVYFAQVTHNTVDTAAKFTFTYRVPEYVREADLIQLTVHGSCTVVSRGHYWLREVGATVEGSDQALIIAGAWVTSELIVPDDTWAGVVKTFAVMAQLTAAATITLYTSSLIANLRVKTP